MDGGYSISIPSGEAVGGTCLRPQNPTTKYVNNETQIQIQNQNQNQNHKP